MPRTTWNAALLVAVLCVSRAAQGQPTVESQALKLPKAVDADLPAEPSRLAPDAPVAFGLDLNNVQVGGDWYVSGTVRSVEKDAIVFDSAEGEPGRFAYKIPGPALAIKVGDPILIERGLEPFDGSLGYELKVWKSSTPILQAGHLVGEKPHARSGFNGSGTIVQSSGNAATEYQDRYQKTLEAPVTIDPDSTTPGGSKAATMGGTTSVTTGAKSYNVIITESSERVPTKEATTGADDRNYILEYVITPRQ